MKQRVFFLVMTALALAAATGLPCAITALPPWQFSVLSEFLVLFLHRKHRRR